MYCITMMDIERYYKYLFTLTSILKCNFMSGLWFEMSFLKAVIIIICQFYFVVVVVVVVVFVCVQRSRVTITSFYSVFEEKKFQIKTIGVH